MAGAVEKCSRPSKRLILYESLDLSDVKRMAHMGAWAHRTSLTRWVSYWFHDLQDHTRIIPESNGVACLVYL